MRKFLSVLMLALLLLLAGCDTPTDPGYFIITDADGNLVTIDAATGAVPTIEYEYHEIHEGDSFSCWYLQDVAGIGNRSIITFRTPDTDRWVHVTVTFSATVMAHGRIYEAPAVTDDTGAPLDIFNRDRNSATTSTVWDTSPVIDVQNQATYFTVATMGNVVPGIEIAHMHLGTGEGKKTIGGDQRGAQEWILEQNTLYAFEIESVNADANTHVITLDWYEHTNN